MVSPANVAIGAGLQGPLTDHTLENTLAGVIDNFFAVQVHPCPGPGTGVIALR